MVPPNSNCWGWARLNLTGGFLVAALTAQAVERTVRIEAPQTIKAGEAVAVSLSASTDAGQGEHIGFFQVDSSLDGGRTWTPVCYLDKNGEQLTQVINLTAGAAGSLVKVRVRVAFRDGLAQDVDYRGAAIRWTETWEKWQEPPTRSVTIQVQ